MAQNMLTEVLRYYHIIKPNTPNAIHLNDELMEEFELIPQGIPALYEYSERFARDRVAAKTLMNTFLNLTSRHRGRLLDVRLVPLAFVAGYLLRPMINSIFSSALESTGRITERKASKPHHPSYMTKATQTCTPIPDPSTESDLDQDTVTFTVAEMQWMQSITTDLLKNEEESKIRQADMLTAIGDTEEENESLRDEVTRLKDNQRELWSQREMYRLGGKDFKDKWEKLQKEYNDLEDNRDELGEMVEKLQDDLNNMTIQRDELKKANGLLEIEKEELEANAAVDKDAAAEYEETCEDLNNDVSRQTRELEEAANKISEQEKELEEAAKKISEQEKALQEAAEETADLKAQLAEVSGVTWGGLDDFESGLGTEEPKEPESAVQKTGPQGGVKEDTPKSSTQPMTLEQSKVEIRKFKKELDELEAVQNTPDPSRDTRRGAIFEQPQALNDDNVEEGAPLRRIQSAPLWLPLPHDDDPFDSLFDGSDYRDDDDHDDDDPFDSLFDGSDYRDDDDHDDDAVDENRDQGQSDQDNTHESENDKGNGSLQNQNDDIEDDQHSRDKHGSKSDRDENPDDDGDDDDEDDGRDGGAEKIALEAYQTQQDQGGDTTPLPEDIPLPDTPANDGQVPIVPEPSPRRVSPNLNVTAPAFVPAHHQTPPAPYRAMGPEDTKNPHIKKLNKELKRQSWMEKSGRPDSVEGEEIVAVAKDIIDDMYDRQIGQFLNFKPIECARGSMFGALNDVSNWLDDVSTRATNDDDANEASTETQQSLDGHSSGSQDGDEKQDGEWSDVEDEDHKENDGATPMLGKYQVTRGPMDGQKDDATPTLGNYKVTRGPEAGNLSSKDRQKTPTVDTHKTDRSTTPAHYKPNASKGEEESEATGDWTDVADGIDEEFQDENSPEENGIMPMLGKHKVTRGDTPSDSDQTTPEAEKESGNDSSPPVACGTSAEEMPRQDVTTPVRVPQLASPSRPDSDTLNHLGDGAGSRALPDTTPKVRLPTPRLCGIDNQDPTPRVRLPQQPIRNQTPPVPVTPSTRVSTQEEQDSSTSSPRAIFRQPPQTAGPPSTPVNQGSPPRDVVVASVKGPVPRGPAAANTTNNNNTPSRQSGRGHGSGSAADSFRRFQERMAAMEKRS